MNKKPHKFDPDFAGSLLSGEREKEGSAQSMIRFSGVNKDSVAVDFGCGPGFLTLPLAKKASTVYAVDINQRMLDMVNERAKREHLKNIQTVKSTEYSLRVPEKADYVFALSLVHEVVRKRKMFQVFHALLKEKGRLIVADWRADPKNWDFGPPARERIDKKDMVELAAGLFKLKKEKVMDIQYYLLFEKTG
ncbi:putative cobalt-precorrin-6B C(15)-methyltransferase (decarboxylating) [uncultured archaeon]|nr:putative cobalt-precorrin-6B C(15)-methyltransferase (decarboxylating) [uncultured archaeon]